jgi:hypothetical protein
MIWRKFLPHLAIPLAAFLNLQSITVPPLNRLDHWLLPVISVTSILSFVAGLVAVGSLLFRMLEKKIKWTTRLMGLGSFLQALLAILTLALFRGLEGKNDEKYEEAMVCKILAATLSLLATSFILFNHLKNRSESGTEYVWVDQDLSNDQRQFIILTIISLTYMSISALIYCYLEDWPFDQASYWAISTFLTIGFGDITPKSDFGLVLFMPVSFLGIMIVGALIYAMRNLFLEVLAMRLMSQYSQFIIVHDNDPSIVTSKNTDLIGSLPIDVAGSGGLERSHNIRISSSPEDMHSLGVSLDSSSNFPIATSSRPKSRSPPLFNKSATAPRNRPNYSLGGYDRPRRTMTISRNRRLPTLTIVADDSLSETHIIQATQKAIVRQIVYALIFLFGNVIISSAVFSKLEGWSFGQGLYFTYCALTTIGYGDLVLKSSEAKSIFLWYIFAATGSTTYVLSMISELAIDEWKVTSETIAKRVDRYETKAKWKKQYASPNLSPDPIFKKGKEKVEDDCILPDPLQEGSQPHPRRIISRGEEGMERDLKPRAYSISLAPSLEAFSFRTKYESVPKDDEEQGLLNDFE